MTHRSASNRSAADALAHVTGEISRLLEQGVMPWRAPWNQTIALAATPGLPLRSTGQPYRGANVVLLWAAQIAITNLFIVVVRFDRWFFGKALALSVASALLLPVIAQSEHQLRWLIIGKPDFASYVEKSTDSRCKIVGVDRQRRMRYEYSYVVEATLKCAGESKTRSCKWLFWHDKFRKEWKETFSLSLPLTCVPGEL